MSLTAAELRAVYTVDEGPLNKSLNGLGGKVGSTLGKVAAGAAGLFAFDKLKDGFFGLTGAASDLNETVNKSNTIFGSNAGAIDQWAKGAAQNLGLSRSQALAAAAGFGDMFGQIGFAGDEAANMSKNVVQMAADLGSFNNLPTADVADRMSAAFRGEYDSLQALIPNINAARVEQEAMAATGKKNADELTAQEKAAAVLAIVQKDGARAMGDFAKTSDGAANAAKIATAEWEDQKAAIGQKLLPALTSMIGFVRSTVIPAVGTLAAFIADDVVPALKDMAEWVQRNETPIRAVAMVIAAVLLPHLLRLGVQAVASWAMASGAAVAGAAANVAATYRVIAGWVLMGAQSMIAAARMAAAWLIAMGPVGWVIAAVVGLVALIVANWDTVVAWTKAAWEAAAGAVAAAWEWIKGAVAAGLNFLVALFMNFTGVGLIIKHWETIKNATGAAWNWIKNSVSAGVQAVSNAIGTAWNWVKTTTVNAWNSVRNAVSTGVSNAVSFVAGLPGRAANAMGSLGSRLWGVAAGAFRSMWDAFANGINNAVSLVQSLPGRAVSAIGNVGSLLYGAGRNLITGFINGIKNAAGGVKDTLVGLTSKLTSWKGPPARDAVLLRAAGQTVINGFIGGMESRYAAVRSSLQGLTANLPAAVGKGGSGGLLAAAQEALKAIRSGTKLYEDWSWKGMSANAKAYNDQLARLAGAGGGAGVGLIGGNTRASEAWLSRYINSQIAVRAPAMAGAPARTSALSADGPGRGIGTLVNIEGDYVTGTSASPHATAQALMIEARTRGFGG